MASLCPGTFDFVLVVPVYGESPDFVDGFRAAAGQAGRLLLVVVLNGRGGATATVHSANDGCFRALSRRFALRALGPGSWLGHETDPTGTPGAPESRLSVLVVDRFTPGRRLPARQGVGLARKIGADVALELIVAGGVRHPYIAMTDADARLPEDYFARIAAIEPGCSGAMFPFWHEPGGERQMDRATALYEIRLRYFQRGLQWAHSPYAFHAVGSTMVVDALSYALVRGVPRRRAGEDFYLLNKLSKLRPLAHLQGAPIRLRSRLSERVPFGTGSESAKLVRGAELELYHPDCFTAVRQLMQVLRRLSGAGAAPGSTVSRPVVSDLLAAMNPVVRRFLEHQGALDAWPGIVAQAPSPVARLRRLHDWFDGFRTLKLIHHLRDGGSPSLPWKEAVRRAPFMDEVDVGDDGATLMTTRTGLLRLEQDLPQLIGPSVEE